MEGLVTFEAYLSRFSATDWTAAVETLAPEIHPVDRDATRVWCAFFPLRLHEALAATGPADLPALEQRLGLTGQWRLADQIDSSHTFLYGHRYWPQIKRAVLATAAEPPFPEALAETITRVADHASRTSSVDRDQLLGISIVGLMTLRQSGGARFGIDQPGEIGIGGMDRHPAHRDRLAEVGAALRQGDVEARRGDLRVVEEQLEEIAHPVEQERRSGLFLETLVLRHHRGLGVASGHWTGLPSFVVPAKAGIPLFLGPVAPEAGPPLSRGGRKWTKAGPPGKPQH